MEEVPGLEWQDGVATLPGSDLKFRMNEDGIMELVDESENKPDDDGEVMCNGINNDDEDDNVVANGDNPVPSEPLSTNNQNEAVAPDASWTDENVCRMMDEQNKTTKHKEQNSDEKTETKKSTETAAVETDNPESTNDEKIEASTTRVKTIVVKKEQVDPAYEQASSSQHKDVSTRESGTSSSTFCKVCGKASVAEHFKGKFCSKQCIGRALGKSYKNRKRLSVAHKSQPAVHVAKRKRHSYPNQSTKQLQTQESETPSPQFSNNQETPSYHQQPGESFNWPAYVLSQNSVTVPPRTFEGITGKDPFPTMSRDSSVVNGFVEGMLLEGVDPLHPSMICALSVAEVQGFRLRLHFINYSYSHDFWVNCDSGLIFPCHFCKRTDRELQPPKDISIEKFSWVRYSRKYHAPIAPDKLFSVEMQEFKYQSKFCVGQIMEAHCSPTGQPSRVKIVDIIGAEIRVKFNERSYWFSDKSSLIHPCGWANENGVDMRPNSDIRGTVADIKKALHSSFPELRQHDFIVGQRLEAVDPRNPILIRVATVTDLDETRIKIHFDGWQKMYDFWVRAESPDIHPAGWCQSTGHPLCPPAGLVNENMEEPSGCPIQGCSGVGHIKGARYRIHHSEFGCPYSAQNLHRTPILDRFATPKSIRKEKSHDASPPQHTNTIKMTTQNQSPVPHQRSRRPSQHNDTQASDSPTTINNGVVAIRHSQRKMKDPPNEDSALHRALHRSVLVSNVSSFPARDLPMAWETHTNALPGVKGMRASKICDWSIQDVFQFIKKLTGSERIAQAFKEDEIDGKSFLLLTQSTILQLLNIKLGPALKIYNAILMAKLNDITI